LGEALSTAACFISSRSCTWLYTSVNICFLVVTRRTCCSLGGFAFVLTVCDQTGGYELW